MSTETPTPRTDAEENKSYSLASGMVDPDFARTLEQECRQWEFVAKSFHDWMANPAQKGCRDRFNRAFDLYNALTDKQEEAGHDPYFDMHERARQQEKELSTSLAREARLREALARGRTEICRLSDVTDKLLNHCEIVECSECAQIACPSHDPMHLHHDGCPSCGDVDFHPTILAMNAATAALAESPSVPQQDQPRPERE